jgi:hypothetical protein
LDGYIKVVIDVEKEVVTAGGMKHVEGEQLLLKQGSKQENLWGGGFDRETKEIDYDSMINIRPSQGNTSRQVMDETIRKKMDEVIKKLLL